MANLACAGQAPATICLEACNLGCTSTGCARTDIAQNEIIILSFSEAVDPNSVNSSSIRFRTPSGAEPVGEFYVNGKIVEFVPTLSLFGGQTFIGFTTGETYTLTVIGGANQPSVVRSVAGRQFGKTLTCTLQSTRGIVDLNGVPPRGTLVVPTQSQRGAAPLDTEVVVEFNEVIDPTPFLSGTQSPVLFTVRQPNVTPGFDCDPASAPLTLPGTQALNVDTARNISVLTFRPSQPLPGNVCVEVNITNSVADLSGRPAQPQTLPFRTVVVPLTPAQIVEEFLTDAQLDSDSSAGTWGGGLATFAAIGGDGRHGDFNPNQFDTGTLVEGKRLLLINCDNTIFPASATTTGAPLAVTDGRFFFASMTLPNDARLRFTGSSPPILTVAGRCDILGDIEVNGVSLTTLPQASAAIGQFGSAGGIFAGAGGKGGDRCLGLGSSPAFNGQDGQDANLLSGHAYLGSRIGSRGRGSLLYPASGFNSDQQFGVNPVPPSTLYYAVSATAAGGGGGLFTPGAQGVVTSINHPNPMSFMGPPAAGGTAVQFFPFPPAASSPRSSLHFLSGGAGGGGAGSGCTFSLSLSRSWAPGAGGAGGGGAMALRAGDLLRLGPGGRLLARGGSTADNLGTGAGAQVVPGGAGAGGSIVLQTGRAADLIGLIDVRGGVGGTFNKTAGGGLPPVGGVVQIKGGDGGPGIVRFEAPTAPLTSQLPGMLPAATAQNVGPLTETDDLVACRSRFYSTNLIFGPEYKRYVVYANVDGVPTVFSDDPSVSPLVAGPGAPVRVLFQAGDIDLQTGQVLSTRPWRTGVATTVNQIGIATDRLNGFRFMLFFDRVFAQSVEIDRVVVDYEF